MDINILRHSASHLMAIAISRLFKDVHFGIGPAIDDGFYYDIDLDKRLEPDDLERIEEEMKKIVLESLPFERIEMDRNEAKKFFSEKK